MFSAMRVSVMRIFKASTAFFFSRLFLTLLLAFTIFSSEGSRGSISNLNSNSSDERHFAAFVIFWEASMIAGFVTMYILLSSLLLPKDPQGSSRTSIFRGLLLLKASLAVELPGFLRSASTALNSLCFSRHSSSSSFSCSSSVFLFCL